MAQSLRWQESDRPRTSRWQALWEGEPDPAPPVNGAGLAATMLRLVEQLPAEQRDAAVTALQEAYQIPGAGYDPDQNLTSQGGGTSYYRRLTQSRRDLQPQVQERMLEIAHWLYDSNPLAKRILELTRDYILGDGVRVEAKPADDAQAGLAEQVQMAVDRFWHDPYNQLDLALPDYVLELGLNGELCLTCQPNPLDGHMRLGYVDPAAIHQVVCAPGNPRHALAVILKGKQAGEDVWLKVVQVDEDPQSASYGRMVGAKRDDAGLIVERWEVRNPDGSLANSGLYQGSCLLFRINKTSTGTRGRSDLLSLADWIDAYDQALFNTVDRGALMKNFVWDVQLAGFDDAKIADWLKNNPAPKPGSVRAHNEKVTWAAVTPDLHTNDDVNAADLLLSYAATGAGLPKTWLNGTMDVNRATAKELGEPAIARLAARQRYVRHAVLSIVTVALDSVELAGMLKGRAPIPDSKPLRPAPWPIAIDLPDLRGKDVQAGATTLQTAATAVSTALDRHLLDEQTGQELMALLVRHLGIDVDLTKMRKRIEDERAKQDEQDERQAELMLARVRPPNGKVPTAPDPDDDDAA